MMLRTFSTALFLFVCIFNSEAQTRSDSKENGVLKTVERYLKALKAMKHRQMEPYWADEVILKSINGTESPLDKVFIRRMRDFERETRTVWKYKIKSAEGEQVTVELSEKNDFYDLLGVGTRTQTTVYFVRDGKIYRAETRERKHASGDFSPTYAAFKAWLLKTEAANDKQLVHNDVLLFDKEGARRMLPWIKKWRKEMKYR